MRSKDSEIQKLLLVLDAETPWITSLLTELPERWKAIRMGTKSCGINPLNWRKAQRTGFVGIPGWNRAFRVSTYLLARSISKWLQTVREVRAFVHTQPWTAGLLHRFPSHRHVYRPHDYFGMYAWDQSKVEKLERELMKECRVVFPISNVHADDLRKLGPSSTMVLPNGVSSDFVQRLRSSSERPADMPPENRWVIGCIGQINTSYDWDLIDQITKQIPEAVFVFVGPIFDEPPIVMERIKSILGRPNVKWLGKKAHNVLPDYLRHFDVCFSPLRITPENNRRSLLRLFDYLASEKPAISTSVTSAIDHQPHVLHASEASGIKQLIMETMSGLHKVDIPGRRNYVDQQTWNRRACQFVAAIDCEI